MLLAIGFTLTFLIYKDINAKKISGFTQNEAISDHSCRTLPNLKKLRNSIRTGLDMKRYPGFDSGCFMGCKKQAKMLPSCLIKDNLSCKDLSNCLQNTSTFNVKKM